MRDTLQVLEERRSCRNYQDLKVPDDIVEKIVRAGTMAATGMNRQSPIIVAVGNKIIRDKMSALNASVLGSDSDPFYGAPQVLVVLADSSIPTYIYDGSLVMGNLMNAAEALGVSSCWIHRAREVYETPEGKALLKEIGVEGEYEGIGNLVIGYDDNGKRDKAPRKTDYVYWVK